MDKENIIGFFALYRDSKGKIQYDMTVRSDVYNKKIKLPFWNSSIWAGYFTAYDRTILGKKNGNPGVMKKTISKQELTAITSRFVIDYCGDVPTGTTCVSIPDDTYNPSTGEWTSGGGSLSEPYCTTNYEYKCFFRWIDDEPTEPGTGDDGSGGSGGDSTTATNFEDKIIDNLLKPCMQTIVTDLKSLTTGVSYTIQKFAGTTPNYNWEIKDGSLAGATGTTDPPALYNKTTGTITTTFDSQAWLNATDLSWARTILHESIHAYLATRFAVERPNFIGSYPQMVTEWGIMQNWNDVHHEEIARSIVNDIAIALEEYGKSKGYNFTKQFYEDMSWAGLQSTATFKALPISDQTRILDTIAIELTGLDTNGSNKTQKGANAGC